MSAPSGGGKGGLLEFIVQEALRAVKEIAEEVADAPPAPANKKTEPTGGGKVKLEYDPIHGGWTATTSDGNWDSSGDTPLEATCALVGVLEHELILAKK